MGGISWIPVEVDYGMFSTEYAVTINMCDGAKASTFVDKSLIQEVNGTHYLKVRVVDQESRPDRFRVMLPRETFETGSIWAEIPR